jgi:hypothetical protein
VKARLTGAHNFIVSACQQHKTVLQLEWVAKNGQRHPLEEGFRAARGFYFHYLSGGVVEFKALHGHTAGGLRVNDFPDDSLTASKEPACSAVIKDMQSATKDRKYCALNNTQDHQRAY